MEHRLQISLKRCALSWSRYCKRAARSFVQAMHYGRVGPLSWAGKYWWPLAIGPVAVLKANFTICSSPPKLLGVLILAMKNRNCLIHVSKHEPPNKTKNWVLICHFLLARGLSTDTVGPGASVDYLELPPCIFSYSTLTRGKPWIIIWLIIFNTENSPTLKKVKVLEAKLTWRRMPEKVQAIHNLNQQNQGGEGGLGNKGYGLLVS